MSFTQRVFTSYQPYADGNTRIGELYRIWYDSITHTLRIQLDPTTPGGTIIAGGGAVSGPAQGITFVGDDSTGTRISDGETLKVTGTGGITTSMSGDVLTINGNIPTTLNSLTDVLLTDPVNGQVLKYDSNIGQWVNAADLTTGGEGISLTDLSVSQQPATATGSLTYNNTTGVFAYAPSIGTITVVGDDSSGTIFNVGETIKIAGTQNITTAVSGDTLTITGPNLTPYLTNTTMIFVGDDSTGVTLNNGETLKIAGASNITTAVSGDTLTITGPDLSGYATQRDYISAYDTQTQLLTSSEVNAGTAKPVLVRSTASAQDISIVSNSRITVTKTSVYNLQFSLQLENTGGGGSGSTVEIWLSQDGNAVPDSNTQVSVNTNSPYVVAAWNFVIPLTAGHYVELMWYTDNHHIEMPAIAAGDRPRVPSAIITLTEV